MATDAGNLDATATPSQDNQEVPALPPSSDEVLSVDSKDSTANASKTSNLTSASAPAPATDTEKKIRRAERFGITVQLSEQEKRNSRAERFGMGSTPKTTEKAADKNAEELKRKARAERFGLPAAASDDDEAKKKARLQRFAQPVKKDDKKDSQPSKNSLSMNGKGNIEPKAAIAGKAGGGS